MNIHPTLNRHHLPSLLINLPLRLPMQRLRIRGHLYHLFDVRVEILRLLGGHIFDDLFALFAVRRGGGLEDAVDVDARGGGSEVGVAVGFGPG